MTVLRIEHPVRDFAQWKVAFDREQPRRELGGVRRYDLYRPVEDPNFVAIDLEFDDRRQAEVFLAGLQELWGTTQAAGVLGGAPSARIIDRVEQQIM